MLGPCANAALAKGERTTLIQLSQIGVTSFETIAECRKRQKRMIGRLQREGYTNAVYGLDQCDPAECPGRCSEACHFATRQRRIGQIISGWEFLSAHPGPFYDVCIVHPRWERQPGDLASSGIGAARQWFYRRSRRLDTSSLIAIGIYEASLNVELGGETFWAGEIHAIVAGAEKTALQKAFRLEPRYRRQRPNNKLLVFVSVENLGTRIAYSTKRFVEQRTAYVTKRTGRQARNHKPPKAKHWAEYDAWLASLPIGGRTIALGCRWIGGRFVANGRTDQGT